MALSAVFLAAFIGTCSAIYAFFMGHVGVWGALGLYVSTGWAVIASLFISNFVFRQMRKTDPVLPGGMQQQSILMAEQHSRHRKTGV